MADLYSNTADGTMNSSTVVGWANARDPGSGQNLITNASKDQQWVAVYNFSGRGATQFRVKRSYMYFDTSGISATVSSATIKISGFTSGTTGSVIAVKSTAFGGNGGSALHVNDFDAITGYSAGASLAGNATDYSAAVLAGAWNGSVNSIASTANLRADMQNNNVVIICFMDYTNDYLNVELTGGGSSKITGAYFTDQSGTGRDPYIEYAIGAAGYGHDVIGVAAASISRVYGVTSANIQKVIGV